MNKVIGKLLLIAVTTISFIACSSEITDEQKNDNANREVKGFVEFSAVSQVIPVTTNSTPTNYTRGEYTSTSSGFKGLLFYWNNGDHIWIDKENDETYVKNDSSNITDKNKLEDAKFFFKGDLNSSSYKICYTGNNSTSPYEVTFAEEQIQNAPSDATRIGEYGDCGVAEATKDSNGKYKFELHHKAAYLVLTPYSSHQFSSSVGIIAVYVTANKPISGKFAFNKDGVGSPKADAKNTIAWYYKESLAGREYISTANTMLRTDILPLPQQASPKDNSIIIVLPPGNYGELNIEYGLIDYATGGYGYFKQTFKNQTLTAGENCVLARDIKLNEEYDQNQYYAWDADLDSYYWKGSKPYLSSRISAMMKSSGYATSAADPRYQNTTSGGSTTNFADNTANRSAASAMNINEALWLVNKGDAKWDEWKMFIMNKHLYNGGIWIKTLQQIANETGKSLNNLKENYNGQDYRTKNPPSYLGKKDYNEAEANYLRPTKAVRSQYMFLPAIGYFGRPEAQPMFRMLLFCGDQGFYWTSNAGVIGKDGAMAFNFIRNDLLPFADDNSPRYDYSERNFTVSVINFDKYTGAPYLVNMNKLGKFRIK